MNKNPFGLDIGATTIKIVWLSKQKEGFMFNSSLIIPTPLKGMLSESPLDEDVMSQTIAKAVSDSGITSKYANVALAENQVYTKVLDMPILSDKELRSAIYWEAEQYVPVPLNTITLVWSILKKPTTNNQNEKMQVLMVGAPTALIEKYQRIVTNAGLVLNTLETEILSAVRSLVSSNSPNSLIVNIGSVSTSFAIVKEGIMVFTYSLPIGGAAINRAIAADLGLTSSQAEEYKKAYGISGKTLGGKIGRATEPVLRSIVNEVKKSIAFYIQKNNNEHPIQQIILTGGTSKLPGIDLFFAQNCGIETVTANPWKSLTSQEVPKEILENGPDYTISVGLAMRDE